MPHTDMVIRTARIDSYFSLPSDLAYAMSSWPEFVEGSGYMVRLRSESESISVDYVTGDDEDSNHVVVRATGSGPLFHAVLGCAAYELAVHSDNVCVARWNNVA
jgi:hypothetical protein